MAITAAAMAAGLAVVGSLGPVAVLVAGIILFVVGSGAFDVAINGAAMGDVDWSRPARLTLLHAAFSGGGVRRCAGAGALIGPAGSPSRSSTWCSPRRSAPRPSSRPRSGWQPRRRRGAVPRAVALAMLPLAGSPASPSWRRARWRPGRRSTCASCSAPRRSSVRWDRPPSTPRCCVGRLIGAGVAGSLGAAATLLVSGSMTLLGMAVGTRWSRSPALAIAGMAVAALGASFVVPVVVSLAGRRAGGYAGRAASYVLTLGYAGFLIGPSLVGHPGRARRSSAGARRDPGWRRRHRCSPHEPRSRATERERHLARWYASCGAGAGSTSGGNMLVRYRFRCTTQSRTDRAQAVARIRTGMRRLGEHGLRIEA